MSHQLNLRIDNDYDHLLVYLSKRRNIPKAILAKELLMKHLTEDALVFLLDDYKAGRIGLKQLVKLTHLPPRTIMQKISELDIEPAISDAADEATTKWMEEINRNLQNGESSWKVTPPKRKKNEILEKKELDELDQ
jgi:transposase-like protein